VRFTGHSRGALLAPAAVGLIGLLVACSSTPAHVPADPRAAAASDTVQVSVDGCGSGWTDTAAGEQHLAFQNTDSRPGEAQLLDSRGALLADVEPLGPNTTDDITISLAAGSYHVRCLMEDEAAVDGPTVILTGPGRADNPGVVPLSQSDLVHVTQQYEHYVVTSLPVVARRVTRLRADVVRGHLAKARKDWLPAHLAYERLGAAYNAFGDLDGAINGLPNGLPAGVHDKHWTGFHRVEYALWHGASAKSILPLVDTLHSDVDKLHVQFADTEIDPLDMSIRAHEISENALQFELTGETDFGSHTNLATVSANLDGTTVVLHILKKIITARPLHYGAIIAGLNHAKALVTAQDVHGRWTPLDALTRTQRERIDSAISELCELLAPVASGLEPRKTS